jgi:hypothetical protein
MLVNLPFLFVGLVLLWFPRQWLRRGAIIGRSRHRRARWKQEPWNTAEPGDPRLSFRAEFAKVRNYVDLLRAAAGSLALFGGYGIAPALAAEPGNRLLALQVLALKLGVLLVALLIQTIRRERRHLSYFAPIFFLAGLSVTLCGHWAALFAFILIWSVNGLFANAQAFLSGYALLVGAFGLLFRGSNSRLALAAMVLCLLPVLLSLLTRRRLGVFSRKGVRSHGL